MPHDDLNSGILNFRAARRRGLSSIMLAIAVMPAFSSERDLGSGYEPVVSADRVTTSTDSSKRVQVLWATSLGKIIRTYSNDLGANWATDAPFYDPN